MGYKIIFHEPDITAQEIEIINRYRDEPENIRKAVRRLLTIPESVEAKEVQTQATTRRRKETRIARGQIFINGAGLLQIDDRELYEGDELQVLIVDGGDNREKWVSTSVMRQDDSSYSISGLFGYSPEGLFARAEQ